MLGSSWNCTGSTGRVGRGRPRCTRWRITAEALLCHVGDDERESCTTLRGQSSGESMRLALRRSIGFVFAAALVPACGPLHRGGVPDAVVVFHNQSTDQADVFALGSGGDPQRI